MPPEIAVDGIDGNQREFCFVRQGMLGTVVDLRIRASHEAEAAAADRFVAGQITRLEAVFSAFDPKSELCRWRRGECRQPSDDFCRLMGHALAWHRRTGGAFNPLTGELTAMWHEAERSGRPPDSRDLERVAAAIAAPRFEMVDGVPVPTGDCARLNVNAIAKGFIVDRVVSAAGMQFDVEGMCLNAGGDVLHQGGRGQAVGIENPLRPYDNVPPLTVIHLQNEAVATSGPSRRGFEIASQRFSHVIDPRTGHPASGPAGVSVVADTTMTADVAATVACVLGTEEALDWLAATDDLAGLVIDGNANAVADPTWERRFGPVNST